MQIPERVQRYSHLGLNYDYNDFYSIKGLSRPRDDGSLTPVFFSKELLLFYQNHPTLRAKLHSRSSGDLQQKTDQGREDITDWGFGINAAGLVFMRLGDIEQYYRSGHISDKDLLKRKSCNENSNHEIESSNYYLSQIAVEFMGSDNEYLIFQLIEEINIKCYEKFGFKIFQPHEEDIENFTCPLFDEESQIKVSVNKLYQILTDGSSINVNELVKRFNLNTESPDGNKLGSIKILEQFIRKLTDINIASPFFVLNDLEIALGHHMGPSTKENKITSCCERLKIQYTTDLLIIYNKIVDELIDSYKQIYTLIEQA